MFGFEKKQNKPLPIMGTNDFKTNYFLEIIK